jgi:hypothetical protein
VRRHRGFSFSSDVHCPCYPWHISLPFFFALTIQGVNMPSCSHKDGAVITDVQAAAEFIFLKKVHFPAV